MDLTFMKLENTLLGKTSKSPIHNLPNLVLLSEQEDDLFDEEENYELSRRPTCCLMM